MNIEQLFEQWYASSDSSPRHLKDAQRQAFFAGHSQGLTRAAEICKGYNKVHTFASENTDHYVSFAQGAERCVQAILTERDKSTKP